MDAKTALIVIDMQMGFLNEASAQCIRGAKATVLACAAWRKHHRSGGHHHPKLHPHHLL